MSVPQEQRRLDEEKGEAQCIAHTLFSNVVKIIWEGEQFCSEVWGLQENFSWSNSLVSSSITMTRPSKRLSMYLLYLIPKQWFTLFYNELHLSL